MKLVFMTSYPLHVHVHVHCMLPVKEGTHFYMIDIIIVILVFRCSSSEWFYDSVS